MYTDDWAIRISWRDNVTCVGGLRHRGFNKEATTVSVGHTKDTSSKTHK